jgi:hypothetical protein
MTRGRGWTRMRLEYFTIALLMITVTACGSEGDEEEARGDNDIRIVIEGDGSGVVTHNLGPAQCFTGTCTWGFTAGLDVTLTATPNLPGSAFAGWGGDCAGVGTCQITISGQHNVTATFIALAM